MAGELQWLLGAWAACLKRVGHSQTTGWPALAGPFMNRSLRASARTHTHKHFHVRPADPLACAARRPQVGDDAATAAFKKWWEEVGVVRGGLLVYNTGRWAVPEYDCGSEALHTTEGAAPAAALQAVCTEPGGYRTCTLSCTESLLLPPRS